MDALKRAEESKQDAARRLTGTVRPQPDLTLEPVAEAPRDLPPARPSPPPDFLLEDAEAAPAAPAPVPAASDDARREAIRNAFAVKPPLPGNRPLLIALGLLACIAVGIGGYIWWEIRQLGSPGLARPAAPPRPAPTPSPAPPPIAVAQAESPPPATPPLPPAALTAGPPPRESGPVPAARTMPLEEASPPASPTTAIRLQKTRPEPDPGVQRAYDHLRGRALDAARQEYERALNRDPRNLDALLGLAAIAQREGRSGDAEAYYQRALEADPKDAAAQAAALATVAAVDPAGAESRLKSALASQPESAPLNFALGNLLARQARWGEAQAAYFNAVAADGDNPDYLFNLAVSLDQLRQPRLAAQHYRLALEAAERRPAAFDRSRAERRLASLAVTER